VSSDVQINAIMKAKKTLIAVGGNFGNTNELIIVSDTKRTVAPPMK